jgi:hypothetical protein
MLSKLDNQLVDNVNSEGFNGQELIHDLHGRRHRRSEHDELLGHLDVAEGSKLHSIWQVAPHPQRIHYGLAQLRTPGLQEGKLLDPFLALPLRFLPSPLSVGHHGSSPQMYLEPSVPP